MAVTPPLDIILVAQGSFGEDFPASEGQIWAL